jgi:Fe-S cluster assembly iron-binding protein IscA
MLQMTSQAAATLTHAREREGLPETYGVRIFANPGPDQNSSQRAAYGFGFVDGPQDGDEVGEADGTPYYVAPEVAPSLDGVVLDVADSGNLVLTRPASA